MLSLIGQIDRKRAESVMKIIKEMLCMKGRGNEYTCEDKITKRELIPLVIVRAPTHVLCPPVSGFIIAKAAVIYLLQSDALPRVRLKLAQDQSRCWMPKSEGCSEMMY